MAELRMAGMAEKLPCMDMCMQASRLLQHVELVSLASLCRSSGAVLWEASTGSALYQPPKWSESEL